MRRRRKLHSYEFAALQPLMDCRVTALARIGERSHAVLRTAMPGNDTAAVASDSIQLENALVSGVRQAKGLQRALA
jgi:hypothetical protein